MPSRDLSGNAFTGNSMGEPSSLFTIPRYAPPEIRSIPTPTAAGPTFGPSSPSSAPTTAGPAPSPSTALQNIVKTGRATPPPAPAAQAPLSDKQKQELDIAQSRINSGTGTDIDRKNVEYAKSNGLWSPTGTGGGSSSSTTTGSLTSPTGAPYDPNSLRTRAERTRQEMFSTVYGYTPDAWSNLDPATQRRLRNQRVQGLAGELGNLNDAIKAAKDEEEANRTTAVDTLNTYLKFGVLDQLDQNELAKLGAQAGLNVDALGAMAEQEDPPELRSIDGNLYAIQWDPEKKVFETTLVMKGSSGSGGGGTSAFDKEAAEMRDLLIGGDIDWSTAWNTLKTRYPATSNSALDQALGGSAGYDEKTGTFTGENTGLATKGGTFEKGAIEVRPDGTTIVH